MGFQDAYNLAKQLAVYPCAQPTPVIYLATFFPAIAPALIEFASFGCRDILKFRLGIGAPCGRIIKNQVAKATPPKLVNAVGNFMKFERALSTGGFWWMIADLAADTTVRWSTLAYRMAECQIALDAATWDYQPFAPDVLFAGVPKPLAGRIENYRGTPGLAGITGATVPEGWHLQLNFDVDYHSLFHHFYPTVKLWIQQLGGTPYDFPANVYGNSAYAFSNAAGHYQLQTQNHATGARQYVMYGLADVDTVITGLTGHASVTALPPMELYLSPLTCWKNLNLSHQEDPAGRNRKGKQPNILDPFLKQIPKTPTRGRPGGMPRSKK